MLLLLAGGRHLEIHRISFGIRNAISLDTPAAAVVNMECLRHFRRTVQLLELLPLIFAVQALVQTNGTRSRTAALPPPLLVNLVRASDTFVELGWSRTADVAPSLTSCELAYGPLADTNQVEVLSNFLPRGTTFTVGGLRPNSSYHFHMVCFVGNETDGATKVASNHLRFTTGAYSDPEASYGDPQPSWSQDPYKGSYHAVFKQTILRDGDGVRGVPSFNVLLGAVAGIVGFLIINVTVVIAVRRCSHRRMRRRRILVLEDRDNEDFAYVRGYD